MRVSYALCFIMCSLCLFNPASQLPYINKLGLSITIITNMILQILTFLVSIIWLNFVLICFFRAFYVFLHIVASMFH